MRNRLLWVDLEMTGLRPQIDVITEVAAIITDDDLNEIATYQSGVKHRETLLKKLYKQSDWHAAREDYTAAMTSISLGGKSATVVQAELIRLIDENLDLPQPVGEYPTFPGSLEAKGDVILAGSSIATDRAFIDEQWLDLKRLLHYHMLDVTALRLLLKDQYPKAKKTSFGHRALDDIRESIAELKYYKNLLKIK